jgi:TonB family protein
MNLKLSAMGKWIETLVELQKPLLLIALLWGCSLALMLVSTLAKAEVRCNCAEVIDSCSATVNLDNMRVAIASNSEACARVDYLIDGQPFTTLLVGGSAELSWTGQPLMNPQVVVESCRICADGGATALTKSTSASTADKVWADAAPKPIVKVLPDYPREAWTNHIEGHVILEFNINDAGQVENIRVIDSTNPVFVTGSLDALSRFRYTPARKAGQAVPVKKQREQFRFRIDEGTNPIVSSNEV